MTFPLDGVIGIIANSRAEIQQALDRNLQCVELRPDLLLDRGHDEEDVMSIVSEVAKSQLQCLFTLRRHDHGGKFRGTDQQQMQLCLRAAEAGAHILDVEWDSACATEIVSTGIPTILSYHNFNGMPDAAEVESITERILEMRPAAIKIVPTGQTFEDAVRMLRWVSGSHEDMRRIGFAMGKIGEFSRILTRAFGGPITYATFDAPVAPGQIPIDRLLSHYHVQKLDSGTRVTGVAGEEKEVARILDQINSSEESVKARTVAVPVQFESLDSVKSNAAFLRMDKLIIVESGNQITHTLI